MDTVDVLDMCAEEFFGKNYGEKMIFLYLRSAGASSQEELNDFMELLQKSAFIAATALGCLAGDLELVITKDKTITAKVPNKKTRQELMRQLKSLDVRLALAERKGKEQA